MTFANKVAGWSLVLLCWFAPLGCSAAELHVLVVQSDNNMLYQTFAKALTGNLPANIHVNLLQRVEDFDAQQADLIVTVGVKAADWVAGKTTLPMLAAMMPSNTYADLLAKRSRTRSISALYLDQPWGRQVAFLRAAMPERHKIGVLHAADTHLDISALRTELARHNGTLVARPLHNTDTLFADLEEVLIASEVLLAVPDSAVYSSNNIRNILLTSYRRGIPLVGFSQAYVKAGALCAIFSTPEQLAAQAGAAIVSFANTGKLPDTQYPALYTIAVNQEVARTLGLAIQSAESLRLQIEKSQGVLR